MKIALIAIGSVLGLIALFLGLFFGTNLFQRGTANLRGDVAANEKTRADGDFIVNAKTQFFNDCAAIQSLEDRAQIFEGELKTNPDAQTNLDAILATRSQLVRQYNANATNSKWGPAPFRDNRLPYQIDVKDMNTICAAS